MVIKRFANSWNTLVLSFKYIGRDKSLLTIPFLMLFGNLLAIAILILPWIFSTLFFPKLSLLWSFIVVLLLYMFNVMLAAAQSWMVYEVAHGKDTTLGSGLKRAFANTKDVLYFSITSIFVGLVIGAIRGKRNSGMTSLARGHVASGLDFMTGMAKRLVVPAMIVTDKTFGEAVGMLKHSLKAAPELLIFEIGFRYVGGAFLSLFLIPAVLVLFSGYYTLGLSLMGIGIVFTTLLGTLINQIYYTLVYMALIEKKQIPGLIIK